MEKTSFPSAQIGSNDLSVLISVLQLYQQWIHSQPVSPKREKQLVEGQFLLVKITLMQNGEPAILTYDEVEHIDIAFKIFASYTREKIPQSKNRDEVLESCEQLRFSIVTAFAPDKG